MYLKKMENNDLEWDEKVKKEHSDQFMTFASSSSHPPFVGRPF